MVQKSELIVDIRTRFLPLDARVFIIFPGPGYRYFDTMRQEFAVFLDIPGFPRFDEKFPDRSDIVRSIVVSDRVREWHNKGMPSDARPERDLRKVADYRATQRRVQFAGMIEHFFDLPEGTIFVVPGPDETSPVLFGELRGERRKFEPIASPDLPDEMIPGRRVEWINEVTRRELPRWLDKRMPSPNPLRQIEKSQHRYVFDLMYERYHYDGRFVVKLRTSSTEFTSLDDYLLNQVVLYAAALHQMQHDGLQVNVSDMPISEVVSRITFTSDIPELRIAISSPGFVVFDGKNIVPLVAGVFFAMTNALGANEPPVKPQIINSVDQSAVSIQCAADVEREVSADIDMMGYKRWQEKCRSDVELNRRTKLEPGLTVERRGASDAQ